MNGYGFYLTLLITVGISLDLLLLLSVLVANNTPVPKKQVKQPEAVPPAYLPMEEWEALIGKVEKDKYKVGKLRVPTVPPGGGEPEKPKPEPKTPEPADPDLLNFIEKMDSEFDSPALL